MTDISESYLDQDESDDPDTAEYNNDYEQMMSNKRRRRSIESYDNLNHLEKPESGVNTEFLSELNCGLTQCTFISCVIGPLAKKEFTLFKVKSRLWVRTLNEIQRNDIEISSKLVSRVTKLPYGVNPSYLGYQTHVVTTQVICIRILCKFTLLTPLDHDI